MDVCTEGMFQVVDGKGEEWARAGEGGVRRGEERGPAHPGSPTHPVQQTTLAMSSNSPKPVSVRPGLLTRST
eukprot:40645-Chlamydomonas_euryale.AAC.2